MKVKKELKKANDRINDQILEEGQEVYDKLLLENRFVDERKNSSSNIFSGKKLVWIYAICSVLVLVISLSIILPLVLKEDEPKRYLEYMETTYEYPSIEEVNSELTAFQINALDNQFKCSKAYDATDNVPLFFHVTLEMPNNEVFLVSMYILLDENYEFFEQYNGERITQIYKNCPLTYTMTYEDTNMLPLNNCFGCLEIDGIKVYFELSGAAEVFTTPIPTLDQVLIIK